MENSEFDKYIKSHTEKDLTPPVDLNWENMNIPLPSEKKKNRAIYFYFIGFLMLAGGLFWFANLNGVGYDTISKSDSNIENQSSLDTDVISGEEVKKEKQDIYKNDLGQKYVEDEQGINTSSIPSVPKKEINTQTITTNNFIEKSKINSTLKNSNFLNQIPFEQKSTAPVIEEIKEIQKTNSILIGQPNKETNRDNVKESNKIKGFVAMLIPNQYSELVLDVPMYNLKLGSIKSKFSILVSAGLNTFQNNYSTDQVTFLQDGKNSAYGSTFNLTFKYNLKNKFFTSLGVSYQKLHSTFSYREDLGFANNLVDFTRVHRTKVIYHNNYFEDVSLNIGLGRAFNFTNNFGFDFSINLNPIVRIDSEGRILNDDLEVVYIEDFRSDQKLYWSAGARLDLFYKINNNKVFAGVGVSQALTGIELLKDSSFTQRPQVLNFNIGIGRAF